MMSSSCSILAEPCWTILNGCQVMWGAYPYSCADTCSIWRQKNTLGMSEYNEIHRRNASQIGPSAFLLFFPYNRGNIILSSWNIEKKEYSGCHLEFLQMSYRGARQFLAGIWTGSFFFENCESFPNCIYARSRGIISQGNLVWQVKKREKRGAPNSSSSRKSY